MWLMRWVFKGRGASSLTPNNDIYESQALNFKAGKVGADEACVEGKEPNALQVPSHATLFQTSL